MLLDIFLDIFKHIYEEPPSSLHLNMVLLGGFVVFFGLISLFVKERLYLSEALCATLVGIAFGPKGFGFLDMSKHWPDPNDPFHLKVVLELSRYACIVYWTDI